MLLDASVAITVDVSKAIILLIAISFMFSVFSPASTMKPTVMPAAWLSIVDAVPHASSYAVEKHQCLCTLLSGYHLPLPDKNAAKSDAAPGTRRHE
jgi:hypothetical protein